MSAPSLKDFNTILEHLKTSETESYCLFTNKPAKLISKLPMQSKYIDEQYLLWGFEKFGDKYVWILYWQCLPEFNL